MRIVFALMVLFTWPMVTQADTIAIINGTVHTVTEAGVLENATVLIDGDEIAAVGMGVTVPSDATVIDAQGRPVTPGLMNVMTKIGLFEVGQVSAADDYRLRDAPFSAAFDVTAGLNPDSVLIPVTRIDGITRAVSVPSAIGQVFDGLGTVVHLGEDANMVVKARAAQYTSFGGRSADTMGGARGGLAVFKRQAFEDALHYDGHRRDFDQNRKREYVLHHLDLEALLPVLEGDITLVVTVNRASDMRVLMDIAEDYEIRLIFTRAREAWKVANELAEAGVGVIIDPSDNLPTTFDNVYATLDNARLLHEAGVTIAIAITATDDPNLANPRNVTQIADVVVWEGDPLEVTTLPTDVIIKGKVMPMDSRQLRLRDRYKDLSGREPMQFRLR